MILITIDLMCLLESEKKQLDKNRKIIVLKNSLTFCYNMHRMCVFIFSTKTDNSHATRTIHVIFPEYRQNSATFQISGNPGWRGEDKNRSITRRNVSKKAGKRIPREITNVLCYQTLLRWTSAVLLMKACHHH